MKNILKIFTLIIGAALMGACEEQLDLKPKSSIGENAFFSNTDEVQAAVYGMYDGLQFTVLREFALTEMRSDNTKTKGSEGEWAQFQNMQVLPTNSVIKQYWAYCYNSIFRANKVIASLDAVTNEDTKIKFEGEALFVRALCHFNLTRAYGDVPLANKIISPADFEALARVPYSEILAFVAEDLTNAIPMLPSRGETSEGQATVGAAKALLAKVKLTQKDYAGAKLLLDEVLADSDYKMMESYNDVFYSEMNGEIIFSIQFVNDNTTESQDFSYEFTKLGRASGINYVTDDFKANVELLDTRKTTLYNQADLPEVGKFITSSKDNSKCGNDWIVLRLADVYLMKAEAILAGAIETTSIEAIEAYNVTRGRAGLELIPTDGSGALTSQMVLDERRVELAFENHRLYDLVRFGEAENVMAAFAADNGWPFSATKLLLPIPQSEINNSFGVITQNPGY